MVDLMVEYMEHIESYNVKSQVKPKQIINQLPESMPLVGESIELIIKDFKEILMPGITHWQHPNFFAYFQANSSPPSILAEMLTATLGVQGMKWETSPASTELEERVMQWLIQAIGLPSYWQGVIQSTASDSTLNAILTSREQYSSYQINRKGYTENNQYRVYCSEETHSSAEKGAKIAGIGKENVVKISTDGNLSMSPQSLKEHIKRDLDQGYIPLCIIATLGTTGTMAMDPLGEISELSQKHNIWLHIDAAYAGSAFILPEYKYLLKGIDNADSFVFNPHKWLFTNFDCSAYFVKDPEALVRTFAILPEYLKTDSDNHVNNHCDWGIPLGRRFRSLKLWFVIRYYGLTKLQEILRNHIELAKWMEETIDSSNSFELICPRSMNLVCFRWIPVGIESTEQLNELNNELMNALNQSGKLYLTHTKVNGSFALRMSIGQLNVTKHHIKQAYSIIMETASSIKTD